MSGEDERKTHIERFYGEGDNADCWIDVEMLDQLVVTSKGQKTVHTFFTDKVDRDDARSSSKKRIKNPQDETQYVEIDVWDNYRAAGVQGTQRYFNNADGGETTRIVDVRKIVNRDIDDADLVADKKPPSDPQEYLNVLKDPDKGQYVYVEVVKDWQEKGTGKPRYGTGQTGVGQATDGQEVGQKQHFVIEVDNSTVLPSSGGGGGDDVTPVRLDPLQWIVNVNWGGDVIVVFIDNSVFELQPAASYDVVENKAELLSEWNTAYQQAGFQPGLPSRAYKVSTGAGEFIKTTVPSLPLADDQKLGMHIVCCAFATGAQGTKGDGGLQRAIDGTKKIIPAIYMMFHTEESDIPFDMAPPGLLWLVDTGDMKSGANMTWKIRRGRHRGDDRDTPPNSMAQVYPLGPSYNGYGFGDDQFWSGYMLYAYRLDKNGTEAVYSKIGTADDSGGEGPLPPQNLPSGWNVEIASGVKGIPFQDPPPLIGTDVT